MIDDTAWQVTEWTPGRSRAIGRLKITHMVCQARGCPRTATHVIYWKRGRGSAAGSNRCEEHARGYAERNNLAMPAPEVVADTAPPLRPIRGETTERK